MAYSIVVGPALTNSLEGLSLAQAQARACWNAILDKYIVEAIPMYVEELLLLLTCYVEGTS